MLYPSPGANRGSLLVCGCDGMFLGVELSLWVDFPDGAGLFRWHRKERRTECNVGYPPVCNYPQLSSTSRWISNECSWSAQEPCSPVALTGCETPGFKLQRAPFLYALSRPFNCSSSKRVNRQKRLRRRASDD